MSRLEKDIFPHIGNKAIRDITSHEYLYVLKKIEARGALDVAKRMRQTGGQIFRYAVANGKADRDITAALEVLHQLCYMKVDFKQNG